MDDEAPRRGDPDVVVAEVADPGEPPQMSAEQVAAIQAAVAQAEAAASAEEMAAYDAMRAGGMDPRPTEGISILDDAAQALVDTRILDGLIRQFRDGLANAKIQWLLVSRGLMPAGAKAPHAEAIKREVERHQEALELLIGIARKMEESEGSEAFPAPTGLIVASVSPK